MNTVIKNARIYTMARDKIIKNGYVEFSGNKILGTGSMKDFTFSGSDKKEIIDAKGGWLLPGFIDAHTHLGMYEDGLRNEGDDLNEVTDPSTPHLRAIDAVNPIDRTFTEALAAGVTTVATGPGSANPISGQFAVIGTYGRRIDDMIIKSPAGMKFALGENPKNCYGSKNEMPETRMATAAIIRENLKKALKYSEKKNEALESCGDDDKDEPDFDAKSEALMPVITGGLDAHFHAHRADDIFTAIRICGEFGLNYVIVHCTEGHLIARELAEENVRAVIGPIISDRSKPELRNLELKNAKVLHEAGILFAVTTDHPVVPLQYLPYCAALCVKGGLDYYEALKAITINPAIILGIDGIAGSIEAGKRADLVLYDGNPLEILSSVKLVAAGGKIINTGGN
ncbi:MAG: amidohydrolase family protein [Oscillospiraceae bacterium]|nr:amidohydrolase family protein [Oscillospiraceae bacterium]